MDSFNYMLFMDIEGGLFNLSDRLQLEAVTMLTDDSDTKKCHSSSKIGI